MSTYSTSPLYNSLNIQLIINNLNDTYFFPDIPQLRESKLQAISFYPSLTATKDVNNVNLLNIADTSNGYLTLYSGNKEAVQNLPLLKLVNVAKASTNGTTETNSPGNADGIFTLDNLVVDFSKSYVRFASGYTLTTSLPVSLCFQVFYIK
jgi:hypothetical protein